MLVDISDNPQIQRILQQEGKRLKNILQSVVNSYYSSYSPKFYSRTYQFKESIQVSDVYQTASGQLGIDIGFGENKATLRRKKGGNAYLPELLNDGWKHKPENNYGRYHYDYYEGYDFLDKAVKTYNATNPYGLEIQIFRDKNDLHW